MHGQEDVDEHGLSSTVTRTKNEHENATTVGGGPVAGRVLFRFGAITADDVEQGKTLLSGIVSMLSKMCR